MTMNDDSGGPVIISATGTKGKTTVVSVIADVLHEIGHDVLHVTTNGHFVNGQQKSTLKDSMRIWGFKTPTLSPGRYLCEFANMIDTGSQQAAVLEATFSCSRRGLGYYRHDVGVFLNVFDDHIDSRGAIKSREELAQAKSFIFSQIKKNGSAVFNADDKLVCDMLSKIPDNTVRLVPCGMEFLHFNLKNHLENGGEAITIEGDELILMGNRGSEKILDVRSVAWTFEGKYQPSLWNLMHAFGALYCATDGRVSIAKIAEALRGVRLKDEDGRMVALRSPNGVLVITDYAHEEESLRALTALGRSFVRDGRELIGVVRLSHERPESVLGDMGGKLANVFDRLVIYDKIDGFWRTAVPTKIKRYPQVEGRVSQIIYDEAIKHNAQSERIVREDEAIKRAADIAQPGDVVIVIVNDDARRSVGFVKDFFAINP